MEQLNYNSVIKNMTDNFFDKQKLQSAIKTRIITKYFCAWSKIILSTVERDNSNLAYLDLYAGQGRYEDRSISTPIEILEIAISNPGLCKHLVTVFNEADKKYHSKLKTEIERIPGISSLKNKPNIHRDVIDISDGKNSVKYKFIPTFSFLDPWGYKGLSLDLINGVIKDWGSECVLFFNFNRINAAISNSKVDPHMEALFGVEGLKKLRDRIKDKKPKEREAIVLESFVNAIKQIGGKFVLPFHFRDKRGRLTHLIIFVSKKFLGYEIMREIMLAENNSYTNGVPSLTFSVQNFSLPLLFSSEDLKSQSLNILQGLLVDKFKGQELKMIDVYHNHSVGQPYSKSDYKKSMLELEKCGKLVVQNDARKNRNTIPDNSTVKFV